MKSKLIVLFVALIIVLFQLPELKAEEQVKEQKETVTVHLCLNAGTNNTTQVWTKNVESALDRLSYAGYRQAGRLYAARLDEDEKCLEFAGNACYGYRNHVYCNAEVLARQLFAIAAVSVGMASNVFGRREVERKDHIQFQSPVSLIEGMEFFDNLAEDREKGLTKVFERITKTRGVPLRQLISIMLGLRVLQWYDADINADLDPQKQAVELLAYAIYEAASNYMMAYLLGHELAHSFGTCLHKEPSRVEDSGLFTRIVKLQAKGEILCPNVPQLDELRADQCGLRVAERMDREMVNYKKSRYKDVELRLMMNLLSISRRLGIDSLSVILTSGLGKSSGESFRWIAPSLDGIPTLAYVQEFRDGYLYAPLRLILFSSLLNELEHNNKHIVRICESSAQRFLLGLNMTLSQCKPKDQADFDHSKLPGAFGEFVPAGVVKGWETGHWEDRNWESFKCPQPPKGD